MYRRRIQYIASMKYLDESHSILLFFSVFVHLVLWFVFSTTEKDEQKRNKMKERRTQGAKERLTLKKFFAAAHHFKKILHSSFAGFGAFGGMQTECDGEFVGFVQCFKKRKGLFVLLQFF